MAEEQDLAALSITQFSRQCWQGWQEAGELELDPNFSQDLANVIFCGMGGSALGPEVLRDNWARQLKIPWLLNRDYKLPFIVSDRSLVVLNSYSGNTEEVLAAAEEARGAGARVIVVSTNGQLEAWAVEHKYPYLKLDPQYNPSRQPRLGLGYSLFALWRLLQQWGLLSRCSEGEVRKILQDLDQLRLAEGAKKLAGRLKKRIPFLIAAEHLCGAVHVWSNCFNENSKSFSFYAYLPEFNHHYLEGLSFPAETRNYFYFLLWDSPFYSDSLQRRLYLTQELLEKRGYRVLLRRQELKNPWLETLAVIKEGLWVSYYLAREYEVDPLPVPAVEQFKLRLQEKG